MNNLYRIHQGAIRPDYYTYSRLLQACIKVKSLEDGRRVHAQIIKTGSGFGIFLENRLVDMYAKCGSIEDARQAFDRMASGNVFSWNTMIAGYSKCGNTDSARQLFDKMPERDSISWNCMIGGYGQHGLGEEAVKLYWQMRLDGTKPTPSTFSSVLSACANLKDLEEAKRVHAQTIKAGFDSDVYVGSALVDIYSKCGIGKNARQVFDKMPERNVVSWNAIIGGYAQIRHGKEAGKLFLLMQLSAVKPDYVTFTNIISACADQTALEQGMRAHASIIRLGFEFNVSVSNALLDMYANCGSIDDARQLFDEIPDRDGVSWNAMISGYAQCGHGEEALKLFLQMQRCGTKANRSTFASVLSACASLRSLEQGKQVHSHIIRWGFESDVYGGSALVDMYGKCGSIEDARYVFDEMSERNVVSWNSLSAGYAQSGFAEESLKLFCEMQWADVKPDNLTFASVLSACGSLAALECGRQVHGYTIKTRWETDVFAGSALVNMYAKCGSIDFARQGFDRLSDRNRVSWTAMIAGYAQNGLCKEALEIFEQMLQAGVKPDHITFLGVLSACSHAGLVDEGRHYFDSMNRNHCIIPEPGHYACMIDLLGRAGHLNEAVDFIKDMPFEPDAVMWGALLGACRVHGNINLGKRAAECLFELESQSAAPYVMLSNIYAAAGQWDDVTEVRKLMKARGVKKKPGCSWIEVKNRMHTFVVDDSLHPQMKEIYAMLERLSVQMKAAGYMPDMDSMLHDVE